MNALVLIAALTAASTWRGGERLATPESVIGIPPIESLQSGSADSVYRAGRAALDRRAYAEAAELFGTLATRYPRSRYGPDALYWKGFALSRAGQLEEAVAALEEQASRFPRAATRRDGEALLIRVKGELAQRGDTAAGQEVRASAERSAEECTDMEVRAAALDALQQMDAERALPILRKVLARRDACSVPLRKNALFILSHKAGAARESILLEVARGDASPQVRQDAVFYLSQAASDASVEALQSLLNEPGDLAVRKNALFALANHRNPRGRTLIREAYGRLTEAALRKEIIFHVAQREDAANRQWLVAVAGDPREAIALRKEAIFHVAKGKGAMTSDLVRLYDAVDDPALKSEIIFHLAHRRDDAGLDKLIAIAKRDPDTKARKDALYHIGQSRDPRAIRAIEEIVTP